MTLVDRFREVFEVLARRKLRTALTALSVAWGIFMLVILLASGTGLENSAKYRFRDNATNAVFVSPRRTRLAYRGKPVGTKVVFKNDDLKLPEKAMPTVDALTARIEFFGITATHGSQSTSVGVRGTHPDHQILERTEVTHGRFLNDRDILKQTKVTVLGKAIVRRLFPSAVTPAGLSAGNILGTYIKLGPAHFRIVGIYDDDGDEGEEDNAYIPISTAQQVFGKPDDIGRILFTVGDISAKESSDGTEALRGLMADAHGYSPKDRRAIRVYSTHQDYAKIVGLFRGIRVFIWIIGLGTILAGIVGVGNIMMISVKERTREIGIRKALGASPRAIVSNILWEALTITTVSGYLGLVTGVFVVDAVQDLIPKGEFFKDPQVELSVPLGATLILVLAGLLAGYFPARRAARVNPIDALRAD